MDILDAVFHFVLAHESYLQLAEVVFAFLAGNFARVKFFGSVKDLTVFFWSARLTMQLGIWLIQKYRQHHPPHPKEARGSGVDSEFISFYETKIKPLEAQS